MAEAAVMMPESDVFQPPASAPTSRAGTPAAGGRPKGYKPFNNEVTPEEFFVLLNEIDDADWPKSLVYVWRRDPFTDSTNGGREPKYVDCVNRAIKESNVKEEHGSGTYKLQLNTNDKYVAHTILTIEDLAYPPHIPPGDWFNNPRNKKWVSWKPIVEKWWKEKLSMIAGPQASATDNVAMGELTRLVSQLANNNGRSNEGDKLSAVLIQWALQQTADERKHDRDADSPGKLAELIRAVKELTPTTPATAPAHDDTMTKFLLDEVKAMREQTNLLLTKMFEMKSEAVKAPDPLAQVETMAKLISTVSGIVQPASPKEPWVEVIQDLGPQVVGALDKFATGLAMRNTMNPQPQRPQTAQPRPMTQQPNPVQVIPAQAQPMTQPSENEPPPPNPSATATATGEPDMDTGTRSMIFQVAVLAANALNLGMDGDHFADQVCYKFGQAVYDQFISNVLKESLLDKFKAVPEAWNVLQGYEPLLPEFIESFYAYATQEDEEETKSISEPEPVPKPVVKKKAVSKKLK